MSTTKHTPGPWMYGEMSQSVFTVDRKRIICELDSRDEDECKPDGKLIAAAPLMYEALDNIADWIACTGEPEPGTALADHYAQIKAALSKARGES